MLGTRNIKSSVAEPDPYVFGLDSDPIFRGTDPDLVPSIIKQK
jgi:hypothetical protein